MVYTVTDQFRSGMILGCTCHTRLELDMRVSKLPDYTRAWILNDFQAYCIVSWYGGGFRTMNISVLAQYKYIYRISIVVELYCVQT